MKKTFEYDDKLPSLPLPTLEHTLERYLDSGIKENEKCSKISYVSIYLVRAVVDDNEYDRTKKIVEQFAKGVGRELHEELKNSIEKRQERNWVRLKNRLHGKHRLQIERSFILL
jgi:carnitine O-octanoyltransferase